MCNPLHTTQVHFGFFFTLALISCVFCVVTAEECTMLAKGCVSRWSVAGLEALGHFLLSFLRVSTVTSNFFILFFFSWSRLTGRRMMRKCTKFDNNIIVIPGRRQCAKPYRLPLVSQDGSIEEDFTPEQGNHFFCIDMQSSSPSSHSSPLSIET